MIGPAIRLIPATPAKAGVQLFFALDSGLRRNYEAEGQRQGKSR